MDRKSLGQFLGGASVVLSLLFVGYEVRQNTAVARNEAYRDMVAGFTEFNGMMATDQELATLWTRMFEGGVSADFDAVENWRITSAFIVLLRQWEGVYRSVQEGILPEDVLPTVGMGGAFTTPYLDELWPRLQNLFTEDFRRFMADSVID